MKIVGYVRVSSEEQATTGVSLRAQREKLEAYRALHDLDLVTIKEDAGISAKSLKRPALQEALAMLRSGEADGLLALKLDRISRSVADWDHLIKKYFSEKGGKQLMSVTDSVDTRSASGRMMLGLLALVSQWEREIISERTADSLRSKIKNGEMCRRPRYGYDCPDGTHLVENPSEQEAIRVMQQARLDGQSYARIAKLLDGKGIQTKDGKKWQPMVVSKILNRRVHVGVGAV